jgi:transposase-like protein
MAKMPNPLPNDLKNEVHSHIRSILEAPNEKTARMLLRETISLYEDKASKAMGIPEVGFYDATAVLLLPEKYRKRLRTTNSIERLNEEIRRRERVIRIFPNRESVIRLLGALLMEQDEKWTTGKKYSDMEEYFTWRESQIPGQTHKVTRIF